MRATGSRPPSTSSILPVPPDRGKGAAGGSAIGRARTARRFTVEAALDAVNGRAHEVGPQQRAAPRAQQAGSSHGLAR